MDIIAIHHCPPLTGLITALLCLITALLHLITALLHLITALLHLIIALPHLMDTVTILPPPQGAHHPSPSPCGPHCSLPLPCGPSHHSPLPHEPLHRPPSPHGPHCSLSPGHGLSCHAPSHGQHSPPCSYSPLPPHPSTSRSVPVVSNEPSGMQLASFGRGEWPMVELTACFHEEAIPLQFQDWGVFTVKHIMANKK